MCKSIQHIALALRETASTSREAFIVRGKMIIMFPSRSGIFKRSLDIYSVLLQQDGAFLNIHHAGKLVRHSQG